MDSLVYREMKKTKLQCGGKFKLFWKILRMENGVLIDSFLFISQNFKRLTGKRFKW